MAAVDDNNVDLDPNIALDPVMRFVMGRTNEPYRRRTFKDPFLLSEEGEDGFKSKYRLRKDSARALCSVIEDKIAPKSNANDAYPAVIRLCTALRCYAGGAYQYITCDAQHMSQATVCRHLGLVCGALIELGKQLVVFNTNPDVLKTTVQGFYDFRGK